MRRTAAEERLRERQQGRGRAVISSEFAKRRFVAVGKQLFHSNQWMTFHDFLFDYLVMTLGKDWLLEGVKKEGSNRHSVAEWYDSLEKLRTTAGEQRNERVTKSVPMTGAVVCYMGLSYNLYLLQHNVELQERYIKRLKDPNNFQGAYYETVVASILIRAGFRLELENEADPTSKHCEFSAISKTTGKKYWVEAKMRSVAGVLGKTEKDGSNPSERDVTKKLTTHLRLALEKPSDGERLIFIDLNADQAVHNGSPRWLDKAIARLEDKEKALMKGQSAYVFVTNLPFHRDLEGTLFAREALAYGLGISDFSKPIRCSLRELYHIKKKHIDGHEIMESLQAYPVFPDTFDGSPRSDSTGNSLKIGETYLFTDLGEPPGTIGKIESIATIEDSDESTVIIATAEGKRLIVRHKMTKEQIEDYKRYGDLIFGHESGNGGKITEPLDFFEWLLKTYSKTSKEKLIDFLKNRLDAEELGKLPQQELAEIYCEGLTVGHFLEHSPEKLGLAPKH